MSFDDTANYLRTNTIIHDIAPRRKKKHHHANTMLKVATTPSTPLSNIDEELSSDETCDLSYEETVTLVSKMLKEAEPVHVYNALSTPSIRDQLHIPYALWKRLEPAIQK